MDHCGICRTWIQILEPPQILIPYIEFFDFVKGTFVKSWKKQALFLLCNSPAEFLRHQLVYNNILPPRNVGAFENLKRLPALVGASPSEIPLGIFFSWVNMTCNPPALNECDDATSPKTPDKPVMDIHSEESNKFLGKQANPPNIRFFQ